MYKEVKICSLYVPWYDMKLRPLEPGTWKERATYVPDDRCSFFTMKTI